jgi:carbon storage regulator
MLVLSRRESEQIVIPELGITLQVIRIKGNSVKIGIDAPPNIRVLRGELQLRAEADRSLQTLANQNSSAPLTAAPNGYVIATNKYSGTKTTVKEPKHGYRICCTSSVVTEDMIAC